MRKLKINFVFLIIFAIVYILVSILYKKMILDEKYIEAYVLNKDISIGNDISDTDVYKVRINKDDRIKNKADIRCLFDGSYISRYDLKKGQIMTQELILKKDDYVIDENNARISITLDKKDISTNSALEKGNLIDIYSIRDDILDIDKKVQLIAKNIKVIDIIDEEGNSVNKSNKAFQIVVSLSNEKIMLINKYKQIGNFSISIIN